MPPGSIRAPIEDVEGIVLVEARLHGESGRDTTGKLVLDTGAGYLGLDWSLAHWLGISDKAEPSPGVELADHALARVEIGTLQIDQTAPVLLFDAEVVRRATGRAVLGLAGQRLFAGRALWIDYERPALYVIPSSARIAVTDTGGGYWKDLSPAEQRTVLQRSRQLLWPLLSTEARAIPFRLAGDNKILVHVRFADGPIGAPSPWLNLVFDTGATKSVLFEPSFSASVPSASAWPSLRGLVAPTLVGSTAARLTLVPAMELATVGGAAPVRRENIDCAVVESELAQSMSEAVGEPVLGLLGYSFFKRYRVGIDYSNRLLWLDRYPSAREEHPFEYSHVGIQLERAAEVLRVLGVAEGSPAALAGIRPGDELVSLDGKPVTAGDLLAVTRTLEGPPGTRVQLVLRRNGDERSYALVRRRLL